MTHESLSAALQRAAVALQKDDPVSASEALRGATLACEAALREGLRLAYSELGSVRRVHEHCVAAANTASERLDAAFSSAGEARRALRAYHR